MKLSKTFTKTTKDAPRDAHAASHKFLLQAGFIKESVAGRYYFLPLGMRVRDKIVKVIEEEMDKTGALKMITPVLHPLELWKETSRTESVGFELMTIKDQRGSAFALGGTAEEMFVDLVRQYSISYKDLPFNIYQFSQKFRDEKRARGGLLRVREFLMKDAYSFHADEEDFKKEYKKMWDAYTRIFDRIGLKTVPVEADNGYIGGDYCHEFIVEADEGESRFLITEDGSYAAHEDVAKFTKEKKNLDEEIKDLQEIDAERGTTMEDGVNFHKMPLWQQIKDVLFVDNKGRFILAIIRGDLDVNETKLMHLSGSIELRHATEDEIRKIGTAPGFISPVGIDKSVIVVADDSLRTIKNAYGGANIKNKDLLNINIDRDFKPQIEGDIAMAQKGFLDESGKALSESRGIEVGNIFQLGEHYSKRMKASFTDQDGKDKLYYMGCYGLGVDRTMATVVEKCHDEKGMIWPEIISPYKYHLIVLGEQNKEKADKFYNELTEKGIEVLYDDRDLSAGEKFADADLIGITNRLVISDKTGDEIELKERNSKESKLVATDSIN